ncbi:MlaD family protein [Tsukamurella spumae]|uniref:MCE family protein n=1 Tax=Tsukamurella spumae TaxID=44753 RepID=A0A846X023_9ACTN|nr:MlaD family protein [Tsukamurella spumae]NKY17632.1 MCE family protein [Tsukamurella spumae]
MTAVLVVAVLAVIGFQSAAPQNLPTPATWARGWTLRVEFPSVLNLPDRAHVRLNGRSIGGLKSIALRADHAEVALAITEPAHVTSETTAELQQDTLLGDLYVGLHTPGSSSGRELHDGDVIPLSRTQPPVQVEDLMSSAASFLGSGGLAQLGNTVDRINAAFPADPRLTRSITANVTTTLNAWSADTRSLDSLLRSVVSMTGKFVADSANIESYLSPESDHRWPMYVEASRVAEVFGKFGPLFSNLAPLTPGGRDLATLMQQVVGPLLLLNRPIGASQPDNLTNLRNLVRDTIAPFFAQGPKVNVRKVSGAPAPAAVPVADQTEQVVRTLRMLGAVR